jgi:hypothetical protein
MYNTLVIAQNVYAISMGMLALYFLTALIFLKGKRRRNAYAFAGTLLILVPLTVAFDIPKGYVASSAGFTNLKDYEEHLKQQDEQVAAAKEKSDAAAEQDCLRNLQCIADRFSLRIQSTCRKAIERYAKYDFKWTTGVTTPMFSRLKWANNEKTAISYIGDKIKFQNGFGAWQNMIYTCNLNFEKNEITKVTIEAGRLP